jgi:MFS superfamily sulfate permease-like transporter/carbonic anhydrase
MRKRALIPEHLLADLMAGVVVFLVALPLCLGVPLAARAPLFSGIVAGIVGGIVVGGLSGSRTSVSGGSPALIAIVSAQTTALGGFEGFLTAVVLAGFLQLAFGFLRAGFISSFFPTSVIKGLLAAIGIIIILKQLPHLIGYDIDPIGEMSFNQPDRETTFSDLPKSFRYFLPGAATIGVGSLVLVVAWDQVKWLRRTRIPGPLVAVLAGTVANVLLKRAGSPWAIGPTHLVSVPLGDGPNGMLGLITFPNFASLTDSRVYVAAVTIGIIASLESLLAIEAVDKIDPRQQRTPRNRELLAQGAGNVICGLLGGLPISAAVIRGTANVNAGGRTRLATMSHGGLLLVCVLLLPAWLNEIPLATLAAILIKTGYRLTNPKRYRQLWREGYSQFVPFVATVAAIVLTDLLVGIGIGLACSVIFILHSNYRRPLTRKLERHASGDVIRVELANQVTFFNRAALQKVLYEVPPGGTLLIDATNADFIDPDVLDLLADFQKTGAPARWVQLSLVGFQDRYPALRDEIRFVEHSSREVQHAASPQQVLEILLEGNVRFREGQPLKRSLERQRQATAASQHPLAVILSCIDSRSPAEAIFDLGLGDVFSVRVAGNITTAEVIGSVEFAAMVAGAKLVVVVGHTRCGAIEAAVAECCEPKQMIAPAGSRVQGILREVGRVVHDDDCRGLTASGNKSRQAIVDAVSRRNVVRVVRKLLEGSEPLTQLISECKVGVVGMMYDVVSGEVEVIAETRHGV